MALLTALGLSSISDLASGNISASPLRPPLTQQLLSSRSSWESQRLGNLTGSSCIMGKCSAFSIEYCGDCAAMCKALCWAAPGDLRGSAHRPCPRNIWGQRTYMKLSKKEKKSVGQCHIRVKSLSSKVKDYIQISAPLGNFGKWFLNFLSLSFIIYKMVIITLLASEAGSFLGCAGLKQTNLGVPCLYRQFESSHTSEPGPFQQFNLMSSYHWAVGRVCSLGTLPEPG